MSSLSAERITSVSSIPEIKNLPVDFKIRFILSKIKQVKRVLYVVFSILIGQAAAAQVFGGFAPTTRWKQIRTKQAQVIFQQGNDTMAQRVAAVLDHIQQPSGETMSDPSRPIPLILQDRTTIPNAYVGLGPYRSEFFTIPPADPFGLGSLHWPDQLVLHEYRHVQQFAHFNQGGSKWLGWLFGEQGRALGNALTVPDWFFEGDAVWQETVLSKQGRGRLPYFFNGYRSLWEANKNYSWMKLRNGSLKDYVPDHYQLGYLITAAAYQQYGSGFWKAITADAAAMRRGFYPFQKAIKKYTGNEYAQFVDRVLQESEDVLRPIQFEQKTKAHFEGDQLFPQWNDANECVYVESSYDQIPRFMQQRAGKTHAIRDRDVSLDAYFSLRDSQLVYASFRPHIRWGNTNYSELQILDTRTGIQKRITRNSYYFAPAWEHSGERIVVAESGPRGQHHLCVLDRAGKLLQRVPNPSGYVFNYPQFLPSGNIISAVRDPQGRMAILQTDLARNSYVVLVPFCRQVLGHLRVHADTILFTASYRGRDQLFATTLTGGQIYLLQHPQGNAGDYQPFLHRDSIYFSRFTATGMRLQQVGPNEVEWLPITEAFLQYDAALVLSGRPEGLDRLATVPDTAYAIQPYRATTKLFNFHSWQPLIDDPDFTLSLLGENVLNTFQSELFLRYNRNEQFTQLGFRGQFGGWFPWVQVGSDFTFGRTGLFRADSVTKRIDWNEWNSRVGLTVPLNLSRGRSIRQLRSNVQWVYAQPYFKEADKLLLGDRNYSYALAQVLFSNQIQRARKQIFPRWAQTFQSQYYHMTQRYTGYQWLMSASLYMPGITSTQHLVLQGAAQDRDQRVRPSFANSFPFSRGYQAANLPNMYRWAINYHFPICYPDLGFGNIVYLQRWRANVFYDDTRALVSFVGGTQAQTAFRSVGMEWYADTKWWNQLPLSIGIRYAYLLDPDLFGGNGQHRFELVLPVNILSR
jgi:hypothetical protein